MQVDCPLTHIYKEIIFSNFNYPISRRGIFKITFYFILYSTRLISREVRVHTRETRVGDYVRPDEREQGVVQYLRKHCRFAMRAWALAFNLTLCITFYIFFNVSFRVLGLKKASKI